MSIISMAARQLAFSQSIQQWQTLLITYNGCFQSVWFRQRATGQFLGNPTSFMMLIGTLSSLHWGGDFQSNFVSDIVGNYCVFSVITHSDFGFLHFCPAFIIYFFCYAFIETVPVFLLQSAPLSNQCHDKDSMIHLEIVLFSVTKYP